MHGDKDSDPVSIHDTVSDQRCSSDTLARLGLHNKADRKAPLQQRHRLVITHHRNPRGNRRLGSEGRSQTLKPNFQSSSISLPILGRNHLPRALHNAFSIVESATGSS